MVNQSSTIQSKSLAPLLEAWNVDSKSNIPLEFSGLAYDSRHIEPGNIFFCIEGEHFDGNAFINDANQKGAALIVSQRNKPDQFTGPYVTVSDIRLAMAQAATYFYDYPSRKLRIIGVTGTNGKTSTTHILESVFLRAGLTTGLIGTMGARWSALTNPQKDLIDLHHTTPQCIDFYKVLDTMVKNDVSHVVMEVSSHALDQKRVALCDFATACLTNITQDHLDFHKTMENYKKAKAILFTSLNDSQKDDRNAVLNADEESFDQFKKLLTDKSITVTSYGFSDKANFRIVESKYLGIIKGTQIKVACEDRIETFNLKLVGRFNLYNALAAITIARAENIDMETIKSALEAFGGVNGRFEVVTMETDQRYPLCMVDYAHTPDGLENVLNAARELVPDQGRLVTVFGCGGDRDTSKRPQMGAIAQALSDHIVVTSDNPRSEEPKAIIADILAGLSRMQNVQVEEDREKAINLAIEEASDQDVIVIAGKGHETYQLIKDKVLDFDDRQKVTQALKKRLSSRDKTN